MSTACYQKNKKKSFKKRLVKGIKIFLKKRKKSLNLLLKGIKILNKKQKQKASVTVANAIIIFLKKNKS